MEEGKSPKGDSPKPRALARGAGFTLVEVLVSAFIMSITLAAILGGFLGNMHLTNVATSKVAMQTQLDRFVEGLRQQPFATLTGRVRSQHRSSDDDAGFVLPTGYQGELLVEYKLVTYGSVNAVEVTMDPIWREGQNRMIGEDANLNGVLNAGEDRNGNGRLDSPSQITIRIAQRSGT